MDQENTREGKLPGCQHHRRGECGGSRRPVFLRFFVVEILRHCIYFLSILVLSEILDFSEFLALTANFLCVAIILDLAAFLITYIIDFS